MVTLKTRSWASYDEVSGVRYACLASASKRWKSRASLKQWPFHVVIKAGPGESNVLLATMIVLKDGGLYFMTAPSPATRASAAASKDDPLLQEGI
ncbi:hypothetical protein ETB97_010556 [Aspergillus alliaceus]|uniref:Uncharacterized protein n=1 Tax=Petromyces alliaceus TaxID=209559 RepID=A0A8H5ZW10_PETAA|nr:hypothetical protein ETB97_010556 [Aspergillus burnettii]